MIEYMCDAGLQQKVFALRNQMRDTEFLSARIPTEREMFDVLANKLLEEGFIRDSIFFDLAFYLVGRAELMKSALHYAKGELND